MKKKDKYISQKASAQGQVIQKGKFKVWTGEVPAIPIEEAIRKVREPRHR